MKRIENNLIPLRLVTVAKNGSPNKDQWHLGINIINIDDSTGTSSYPELNNSNNGNYLKKVNNWHIHLSFTKLVDYMENDLEMIEDYNGYKNEKNYIIIIPFDV